MALFDSKESVATTSWSRVLGTHSPGPPGPVLVAVGGIHGNEQAGLWAIQRVLHALRSMAAFKGTFVGLAGNLAAVSRGRRYIHADLNRVWSIDPDDPTAPSLLGSEFFEYRALRRQLEAVFGAAQGDVTVVDLHSSSADGPPFMLLADGLPDDGERSPLPIPRICGLIEKLDGILIHYALEQGHRGIVFEGGQHGLDATVDHLVTCLWLLLLEMGCVEPGQIEGFEQALRELARATMDLPSCLNVVHRHAIEPRDRFQMEPGYRNFDHVFRGEALAYDRHGEVTAPRDGRILLPLYQGQGNDGFFIGVEQSNADP